MTTAPSRPRSRLGTRELVIAFAIVEAVALLWLVTQTKRSRRHRPAATAPAAAADSTPRSRVP